MGVSTQTARARITQSTNSRITNLSLTLANTEYSHALSSNLKRVIIRVRGLANIKLAFIVSESGTKFFTIPAATCFTLWDLDFTAKFLYVQSDAASQVLEILEFY